MSKKLFLYKDNSESRDCCAYIDSIPTEFECGHYFSTPCPEGACYFGSDWAKYSDITTVLSEEEYCQLMNFAEDIKRLGMRISRGDERYQKGIELCKYIQPIYDKLNSVQAGKLFDQIWEEEKDFLCEKYYLTEEECEMIADEYGEDYRDRAIIAEVYEDYYDLGYETAIECGYVDRNNGVQHKYFDFARFGEDLAEEEEYIELSDGRIVQLAY